jgi:hypothetical protein
MIIPETINAIPRITRYASLNSSHGMRVRFSDQRSDRKLERGSPEESLGYIVHSVKKRANMPSKQNIRLRVSADFCLMRILIKDSNL